MNMINSQANCNDVNEDGTLTVDQALNNMLNAVTESKATEHIPLIDAYDRILARSIISPIDVPAHRNSAVDGYALRGKDLPIDGEFLSLKVAARVVAGHPYHGSLKSGEAIQIMTGAEMPAQADTVVMLEHIEKNHDAIRLDSRHKKGQNVRQAGEDMQQGQTVLNAGIKLTPPQIGLIASLGLSDVHVKRKPTIAIFSTGDEILNLGDKPQQGCIYDSNRYSLISALKKLGCEILDMGIIPDDPDKIETAFLVAADNADVIFTSGGVSVGDADYTKQVLAKRGHINFWKVAIKPGRPIAFGHLNDTLFFGLPGNPVAVMVTFYLFAVPTIQKLMGLSAPLINPQLKVRCSHPIRKLAGRTEFQRGILSLTGTGEYEVCTTGQQGSGVLRSMSEANAFIILEHDRGAISTGEFVTVQAFNGLFQ